MKSVNYSYQPLSMLVQQLKQLCSEKKSGMLFIISEDKYASHILLSAGHITEITYGYEKGEKALVLLSKVRTCRFHFSQDKHKNIVATTSQANYSGAILNKLSTTYKEQKNNRYILKLLESLWSIKEERLEAYVSS